MKIGSCLTELVVGMAILALIICGFLITIMPEGQEFLDSSPQTTVNTLHGPEEKPTILLLLTGVMGFVVIAAATMLRQSIPDAAAIGCPGTGCANTLAIIAGIIVLIGFCYIGALATMGGG